MPRKNRRRGSYHEPGPYAAAQVDKITSRKRSIEERGAADALARMFFPKPHKAAR